MHVMRHTQRLKFECKLMPSTHSSYSGSGSERVYAFTHTSIIILDEVASKAAFNFATLHAA